MLLFTGPPGSGKTHRVLQEVRDRLRAGRADFRLLAPTATMAEHVRNLLAREGFVFRARLVSTLSRFIQTWVEDLPPVSGAALDLLIREALARLAPAEFEAVASFEGFRAAVAKSIEELSSAGCNASQLARVAGLDSQARAFRGIYAEVERTAAARGLALPGELLRRAAERIREQGVPGIEWIFFDGFFGFTDPELDVIEALGRHAGLTVTLPAWQGAESSRRRLAAMGFEEKRCEPIRPRPEVVLLKAQTQEMELEEVAARVLEQSRAGRPFREMGIVVRTGGPYVPALQATLERFGIPARFYFATSLASHSLVRRFTAALDGLQGEAWRDLTAMPAEWANRVKSLRAQFSPPAPVEPVTHEMVALWRSAASALAALEETAGETARLFPPEISISFSEFWRELKTALRLTPLRVPDHRRNVVHVLDAYEARQWELPIVFVCGLLEKQPEQDPIVSEDARRLLRQQGIRVRTAAERDQEERFLFDLATTRATQTLVLSYPQFNQKGEETLRSFHLERFLESTTSAREAEARFVRTEPRGSRPSLRRPVIYDAALRQWLAVRHASIAATALETFLQCPFQFFARHTLRLEGPSLAPEERLDTRVQGKVAHEVLARWLRDPQAIEPLFHEVFRKTCEHEKIPDEYRTEAVRLELLRNLQRFMGEAVISGASRGYAELDLALPLDEGLIVRCRIDRIDSTPDGKALIVDYKYSAPDSIKKLVRAHEDGTRIQGGIYTLAVQRSGREVAEMRFAGIRGQVTWAGWGGESLLREVMEKSKRAALEAMARIREGMIVPKPADESLCQYCEFRDACRVESMAKVAVSGEAEEWT